MVLLVFIGFIVVLLVFVGFIVVLNGFLHDFGFAFLVIFYFHPFLGAFWVLFFAGFLSKSKTFKVQNYVFLFEVFL